MATHSGQHSSSHKLKDTTESSIIQPPTSPSAQANVSSSSPPSGQEKSIFILVVGPTGAGKSTFINSVVGRNAMSVGHKLSPCTSEISSVELENIQSGYRVFLVDTPGFNAEEIFNVQTSMSAKVCEWLKNFRQTELHYAGIIYIQNLSHTRITAFPPKELSLLRRAFNGDGNDILLDICKRVAFVANLPVSADLNNDEGPVNREAELKNVQWKDMLDGSSLFFRFVEGPSSNAREIVTQLAGRAKEPLHAIQDGLNRFNDYIMPGQQARGGGSVKKENNFTKFKGVFSRKVLNRAHGQPTISDVRKSVKDNSSTTKQPLNGQDAAGGTSVPEQALILDKARRPSNSEETVCSSDSVVSANGQPSGGDEEMGGLTQGNQQPTPNATGNHAQDSPHKGEQIKEEMNDPSSSSQNTTLNSSESPSQGSLNVISDGPESQSQEPDQGEEIKEETNDSTRPTVEERGDVPFRNSPAVTSNASENQGRKPNEEGQIKEEVNNSTTPAPNGLGHTTSQDSPDVTSSAPESYVRKKNEGGQIDDVTNDNDSTQMTKDRLGDLPSRDSPDVTSSAHTSQGRKPSEGGQISEETNDPTNAAESSPAQRQTGDAVLGNEVVRPSKTGSYDDFVINRNKRELHGGDNTCSRKPSSVSPFHPYKKNKSNSRMDAPGMKMNAERKYEMVPEARNPQYMTMTRPYDVEGTARENGIKGQPAGSDLRYVATATNAAFDSGKKFTVESVIEELKEFFVASDDKAKLEMVRRIRNSIWEYSNTGVLIPSQRSKLPNSALGYMAQRVSVPSTSVAVTSRTDVSGYIAPENKRLPDA